jgi:hypothetical protein
VDLQKSTVSEEQMASKNQIFLYAAKKIKTEFISTLQASTYESSRKFLTTMVNGEEF